MKKDIKEDSIDLSFPSLEQLKAELQRERYKSKYRSVLKSTIYTLIVVAAVSVLVATIWMPVLQIYGSSMEPTVKEGDIVVSLKGSDFESGDLIAFYFGNKILVKRCIAGPGQWVDIDEDGLVYVDGQLLDEPYIEEKSLGDCNINLPYQVPDSRYFCMGDHRLTSVDSRNTAVGCVSEEQIVGKIVFRVWPLSSFGSLK
ncbi:MAG: signal peptidase I [Anaerovoracaceae bacterium]